MSLDLRIPIGLLFGIFGVLLVAYGLATGPEVYRQSLGVNINAWWGVVMLVFAGFMLALAWRARARAGSQYAERGRSAGRRAVFRNTRRYTRARCRAVGPGIQASWM